MPPGMAGRESRAGFKYKARATGLEGAITLPIEQKIEPVASVRLDDDGGFNNARVENFRLEHFVAFDSSRVSVTGSFSRKEYCHSTVTTAIVDGVDVLGIITADRIVARILSRFRQPDPDSDPAPEVEPSILATGSHFENLVIAGHPVKVRLNTAVLCELPTYSKVRDEGPARLGAAFHTHDPDIGEIRCTLVESIDTGNAPELQLRGRNSIFIEQFGTIHLAEVVLNRDVRSVTMIRVELGCAHEGRLALASAEGGGSTGGPRTLALFAEGGGSTGGPKGP